MNNEASAPSGAAGNPEMDDAWLIAGLVILLGAVVLFIVTLCWMWRRRVARLRRRRKLEEGRTLRTAGSLVPKAEESGFLQRETDVIAEVFDVGDAMLAVPAALPPHHDYDNLLRQGEGPSLAAESSDDSSRHQYENVGPRSWWTQFIAAQNRWRSEAPRSAISPLEYVGTTASGNIIPRTAVPSGSQQRMLPAASRRNQTAPTSLTSALEYVGAAARQNVKPATAAPSGSHRPSSRRNRTPVTLLHDRYPHIESPASPLWSGSGATAHAPSGLPFVMSTPRSSRSESPVYEFAVVPLGVPQTPHRRLSRLRKLLKSNTREKKSKEPYSKDSKKRQSRDGQRREATSSTPAGRRGDVSRQTAACHDYADVTAVPTGRVTPTRRGHPLRKTAHARSATPVDATAQLDPMLRASAEDVHLQPKPQEAAISNTWRDSFGEIPRAGMPLGIDEEIFGNVSDDFPEFPAGSLRDEVVYGTDIRPPPLPRSSIAGSTASQRKDSTTQTDDLGDYSPVLGVAGGGTRVHSRQTHRGIQEPPRAGRISHVDSSSGTHSQARLPSRGVGSRRPSQGTRESPDAALGTGGADRRRIRRERSTEATSL